MKYKIVLIGSGNLATSLGVKLFESAQQVVQVYSKTLENAKGLAKKLHCNYTNSLNEIDTSADIYIIGIKDDKIHEVSIALKQFLKPDKIIAHTSGVNSPNLIDDYFINRSLFYPLQSFSKIKTLLWDEIPIFLEGSTYATKLLTEVAHGLSNQVLEMNDQIRTHLHLASVFANNFSNFNLLIAERILAKSKMPFTVIQSLMKETIDKAFALGSKSAQTGPAKRGDNLTIEKHIRLLVTEFPEYRSLYKKYSQIIQKEFKHENPGTDSTS
ncbi:MAG: DUF2520 domain-containing protein [Saprospiraceae bacterium]|nr:DUF2520 domain-containing protein [Saprospiraceae bacterium]